MIDVHQPFLALAELFDWVEDALVWVKDRDGRYCWVNRAFVINYELDNRDARLAVVWSKSSARPTTTSHRPSWPISFAWTMSTC